MSWRARSSGAVAAVMVALLALGACSDDDNVDEPGGSPPTLYEPTVLIDPTPTTQP
jgi:hypothetical protein